MNEKRVIFPQGTPPGKIGHFCKNTQNQPQHHYTGCFSILQKACKILEKIFLANLDHFWPRDACRTQFPVFNHYPRKLMINKQKTGRKCMKNGSFFPRGPPREKLVIFAKMLKSSSNSNVRAVSLFCKSI